MINHRFINVALANEALTRELFDLYEKDPTSVTPDWAQLFQSLGEEVKEKVAVAVFSEEKKKAILKELTASTLFENFLHTKFPGQKRFSLEGAETLIPMLSFLIEESALKGIEEVVLGMAHRGRLNVLAHVLKKPLKDIFTEFKEGYFPDSFDGNGDVKYHKGFLSESITVHGHKVKISLVPNPSHLESVDPIVLGEVRGKIVQKAEPKVLGVLVHGDAALSGQGIVYETLQLYKLKGYETGGTIHLVVNNQIGFTTSPEDSRSTPLCTDIAKTFNAPVLEVDAEDPESCISAVILAVQLREKFHTDVFIEMNCYRKYGHNESDEPTFTQPLEYKAIRAKKPIWQKYLESTGLTSFEEELKAALHQAEASIQISKIGKIPSYIPPKSLFDPVFTAVPIKTLQEIGQKLSTIPPGFKIHPKVDQLFKDRLKMVATENEKVDWGMAEQLAFGSILLEGTSLRLSGQDSARGTFSHRHALIIDQENGQAYSPLQHLSKDQGRADIINSPLSEFAVLGFEYGYSVAYPHALVIWEAQFGDFSNSAQVIIDQYIASGETKWGQKTSLVLLLPHGYEGQGPEHSSARLERYLSLAADDNLFICNPSTPAQFFHLLRRQVKSAIKKPLVCLTPKVLLRHVECVSLLSEFGNGHFEDIIESKKGDVLVFCSGKIYYELKDLNNISIIRIEQLYPLNSRRLSEMIACYRLTKSFIWIQEEPKNMGAYSFIAPKISALLPKGATLEYIGRAESASPATGCYEVHKQELAEILAKIRSL